MTKEKQSEIREIFANMGEDLTRGLSTFPDVTNPNYYIVGHSDFRKKLKPGDVGYIPYTGKIPEADSIKSQEDWNRLDYSTKLVVFSKKFPAAYAEMPKMYGEYREKAVSKSKQCYDEWYATMMQKYVETYLPVKIYPKIIATKPLIRKC